MPFIDLIIPIYNRVQHVDNLVHMLENQYLKDFCAIFVDDGSTDGTFEKLRLQLVDVAYPYKLLKQENKGPSAARNTGIRASESEWLVFADSDDMLLPKYLEYLLNAVTVQNADMGFCHLKKFAGEQILPTFDVGKLQVQRLTATEAMKQHYTSWIAPFCLILNRQWALKNQLMFDEDCRYCEDLMFITKCIAVANYVVEIKNELYVYLVQQDSLLRNGNYNKYINGLEGFTRLEQDLEKVNSPAVDIFFSMGRGRFLLANLRRAALQMEWKDFCVFAKKICFEDYYEQVCLLSIRQRIAAQLYRISRFLFYCFVNLFFND